VQAQNIWQFIYQSCNASSVEHITTRVVKSA